MQFRNRAGFPLQSIDVKQRHTINLNDLEGLFILASFIRYTPQIIHFKAKLCLSTRNMLEFI